MAEFLRDDFQAVQRINPQGEKCFNTPLGLGVPQALQP
jgi:hypothetical protein